MLFILSTTVLTNVAHAADLPSVKGLPPASESQEASWEGLYFGLNYGSAWGTTDWSNPTGAYLLGNTPRFPASSAQGGIFGGVTLGYNHQVGPYVLGVEGDVDITSLHGNAVCGGIFGTPEDPNASVANQYDPGTGWACKSSPATLATLDARAGYALGGVLLFAKGGLAYANEKLSISVPAVGPSVVFSQDVWGFNVGAGLEYALGGGWSAKAEYDFYGFGNRSFSAQDGLFGASYGATTNQNISVAKFGLNRHWGAGDQNFAPAAGVLSSLSGEFGARMGWGGGRYRFDLFAPGSASQMLSRLIWPASGVMTEAFGRVDAPTGIYLKGFIGGIALGDGGTMHDEDFALKRYPGSNTPYSNTVSTTKNGSDLYGAIDLGYAYRGGNWRLGPFVGYTYLQDRQNAYGCAQVAAYPMCSLAAGASAPVAGSQIILSRFDNWNAVRLGLAGDVMLTERFKLAVDAAWLPYANVGGSVDNHWLRAGVNPLPDHGHGSGYQFEAVLSYLVTDRISVGAGARYWNISANGVSTWPTVTEPTKVYVDRTMVFGQVSYAFGSPAAPEAVVAKF
jgi:opacity protein-like surface antigen